ncbi:MBL fold metallo-hydrolase [Woodsholea maritima]|uniref:MBL fold metallo-hydrolase n=1 Tax=Woodsholea maritima TaxID=240237 RepID=UPI00037669CA|nr:MBL fold metallo-hydrolase [Woodsholea maritima]
MTAIPFKKDFDFEYGRCDRLSARIRRIVAPNPGPFTYTGTGVYIIGEGEVAVLDPGPVMPEHIAALDKALEGERVTHVFVTHHHLDHSPMAKPLAQKHGCQTYGYGPAQAMPEDCEVRMEAGDDRGFTPDVLIQDGAVFSGPNWTLEALHTPGHTSNHMCYALKEENILFCGDHVMAWSTSVVSPPDGDMGDYLSQLERIRARQFARLWPTHGPAVDEPDAFLGAYIAHRRRREAAILGEIEKGQTQIRAIVETLYSDVDKRLHPAAAHSVFAHVIHLIKQGKITTPGAAELGAQYHPVSQIAHAL